MASYLPEGGKVAVIQHMLTTTTGIERTRGVLDALNEAGNIEILGSFCCDNSTEQAQTITTELLSADPEIRGFVCTNEVCNVGAANALVELGMGGARLCRRLRQFAAADPVFRAEHHSGHCHAAAVQHGLRGRPAGRSRGKR